MKTKLDTVATAANCKSRWMTCCKVPKCDVIALQEMYDTARKIENNLVMYWCLSSFRKEMQCVQDVGLYLVLVSFATGVYGCSRECGATDLCWREGGRGGAEGGGSGHSYSQPKILTLSHILSPKAVPKSFGKPGRRALYGTPPVPCLLAIWAQFGAYRRDHHCGTRHIEHQQYVVFTLSVAWLECCWIDNVAEAMAMFSLWCHSRVLRLASQA